MSELILTHQLNKDVQKVFEALSDPDKFTRHHPLIQKMEPLGANTYLVHEKISFLFIPIVFRYKASIHSDSTSSMVGMTADVFGMVHIELTFRLSTTDRGCRVDEIVNFHSKLPVTSILKKVFQKQHLALFKSIGAQS